MDQIKIGKFISECRNKENLSLEQLAKKLDIDVHTIIKWESGKSLPDSSMIINLCKVLNITPTDLLNGELIEKNEFNNNQEKLILELHSKLQSKQKKILLFTWVSIIIFVLFYALTIIITNYAVKDEKLSSLFMMISTIIFIIAMSVDFIMDFEVGHQVCPHCNHVFKPSLLKVLFARKKGTPVNLQRKMKCPKCKETSWTNRILD